MPTKKIDQLEKTTEWEDQRDKLASTGEKAHSMPEAKIQTPSQEAEKVVEKKSTTTEVEPTDEKISLIKKLPAFIRRGATSIPTTKDDVTVKIEKIMEAGLGDAYSRLSPIAKQEFKIKGEETALEIRDLLRSARVKVKKIIRLIIAWLRVLPGINKFFLEQEAKIKTDRIIELSQIIRNQKK